MSDAQTSNTAVSAPSAVVAPQQDPGHTLGIVGLVLSIVASWIGLIISVVAFNKSKSAGFHNGLAKAGIIVGIITTTLGVLGGVLMALTGAAQFSTY